MKSITRVLVLCLIALNGYSQDDFNMELVANVTIGEDGNDVWGYVDSTGLEYAIMGTRTKTNIWSLEDPSNPSLRASIPGPAGVWRDIKHFEDHLYVTSDQGTEGLLIIDMSEAPETITSSYWHPIFDMNGMPDTLDKCHNLYIDTEQGYCYLAGCDVSEEGVLILDLNVDKKEPVLVGMMDNNYTHDVFVKNDKMYTSDILIGSFNVYDVSDKTNPVFINGAETSRQFAHNAWLSDDEKFLFTTDERPNAWVDAFDISDLNDIQFLDRYRPIETEGTGVIPHNTHYMDGYLITSWYTDGLVILDAHEPDNLVKVGAYDTETVFTDDFEGCWGAYPFLPSGLILASDINHGLFIFQPKTQDGIDGYQRACYLEGNVTDLRSGAAIPNATVRILSNNPNESNTGLTGGYKTGQITPGEFQVEFSHPNYDSETLTAVLVSGEMTILDAQLGSTELSGTVSDKDGNPIADASILIENVDEGVSINTLSDADGNWMVGAKSNLEYEIYSAKWGYRGVVQTVNFVEGNSVDFILEEGYEDDFFSDLGWESDGNASSGMWEIARPNSIFGAGQTTQTSSDIPTDLGNTYYVTGADGTSQGANDIDDGNVIITSPAMDFTGFERIDFSYYLWFVNVSGNGAKNDFVTVSVSNGIDQIELTRIDQNGNAWSSLIETSVLSTQLDFNDNMRIIVYAEDVSPGHVAEAGFDVFKADGFMMPTNVNELTTLGMSVFPNPSKDMITLRTQTAWEGDKQITITNHIGKVILRQELTDPEMNIEVDQFVPGLYSIQVIGNYKKSETIKFSKI